MENKKNNLKKKETTTAGLLYSRGGDVMKKQVKVSNKTRNFNSLCKRILENAANDIYKGNSTQMKDVVPLTGNYEKDSQSNS